MGSFSILHWILVLFFLVVPAAILGLIIWLATRASGRRPASTARAVPPAIPPLSQASVKSRLQALDDLKAKGLVTDVEYDQQRASILQDI
jgi:hypothetical protein